MLEGLALPSKSKPCKLARQMTELSEQDKEILNNALQDPRWSTNGLRRELAARGFFVSYEALTVHRNKECLCVRES